jgi:serine/threonine protein kinase
MHLNSSKRFHRPIPIILSLFLLSITTVFVFSKKVNPKVSILDDEQVQELVNNSGLRYKVVSLIGKGGFGQVFLAQDGYNNKYAIKIFQNLKSPDFEREVHFNTVFQNISHIHGLDIYNHVVKSNFHRSNLTLPGSNPHGIIVYEYLEYNMNSYLQYLNDTCPDNVDVYHRTIFYKIFESIDCLHQHQIVYKDLKRENVLVDDSNVKPNLSGDGKELAIELMKNLRVKLTDFGISLDLKSERFNQSSGITREYAAPEYFLNFKNASYSFDLWSLGILIIEHHMRPKYRKLFIRKYSKYNLGFINKYIGSLTGLELYREFEPFVKIVDGIKNQERKKNTIVAMNHYLEKFEYARSNMNLEAYQLVKDLLQVNESLRISTRAAMNSPFFDLVRQRSKE